jgi:hypothetical protein
MINHTTRLGFNTMFYHFGHKFPNCLDLFVHETTTLLIANANHVPQLSVRILSSEDPLLLNTSNKLKIHVFQFTKIFLQVKLEDPKIPRLHHCTDVPSSDLSLALLLLRSSFRRARNQIVVSHLPHSQISKGMDQKPNPLPSELQHPGLVVFLKARKRVLDLLFRLLPCQLLMMYPKEMFLKAGKRVLDLLFLLPCQLLMMYPKEMFSFGRYV